MAKLLKFGLPRTGEMSTWLGAGGFVSVLGYWFTVEESEAIIIVIGLIWSALSTFNKEADADA